MNSRKVREAMRTVFERLRALDPAELRRQIDAHRDGPISKQLIESGMFEGRVAEGREWLPLADEPGGMLPTYIASSFVQHVGDWFHFGSILSETSSSWATSPLLAYTAKVAIGSAAQSSHTSWIDLPNWYATAMTTKWLMVDQTRPALSRIGEAKSVEQLAWAA